MFQGLFFLLGAAAVLRMPLAAQTSVVYGPSIITVAGTGTAGNAGNNGPATSAQLSADASVAYDPSGNLYIVDTANDAIRKVSGGVMTTVAGTLGTAGFTGDGGLATAATLSGPNGIAFDSAGNLYIMDTGNARVREVTVANGIINTVAGNGTKASYTADGPALGEPLNTPNTIAIDSAGNIYIADSGSNRVLEVTGGQMILYAGSTNSGGIAGDGGSAKTAAKFAGPRALCIDSAANLYLVDKSHSNIRKVTASTGLISTVAGSATGTAGNTGDSGLATSALLSGPLGCAVDSAGDIYIADAGNQKVRLVTASTGNIATFAGTGTAGYTGDGGPPTSATLNTPTGVAISAVSGQVAIADTANDVVRAVSAGVGAYAATSVGSTSASTPVSADVVTADTLQSYGLFTATPADFTFGAITGCTLPGAQSAGTICTAPVAFTPTAPGIRINQVIATDSSNIKYIFPVYGTGNAPAVGLAPGTISDYAGTGTAGSTGDGGPATTATLNAPSGVALDAAGNLYIAGSASNKIRLVNATSGNIATAAGTGTAGYSGDGAAAAAATLSAPTSVALDTSGNVYIADSGNDVIRKISASTGFISTVAGTGTTSGYSGDGAAATSAKLATPKGVAADLSGNIYIADTSNNVIREVNASGTISTLVAAAAGLSAPAGVSVDASGNLYIADTGNNVIRKLSGGTLTTVAGTAGATGSSGDGAAATSALLNAPTRVVVDAAGDLYIADSGNNKIRAVSAATGIITTIAGTGTAGSTGNGGGATSALLNAPNGVTVDQLGNLFIADTGNNRIEKVNSSSVSFAFGSVNTNITTPAQTLTVTNIGNQTLTLSNISISSGFAQVPGTGACTSTTTLAAGASCQISITFTPTTATSYSGSVVITDNALNNAASKQTIPLTGTGTIAGVPTTINITAGNSQTVTPLAPFPTNLQVQVLDQFSNPSANVTVVFTAPATGATGTFANGTNTTSATTDGTGKASATLFTAGATRGTFAVTALATGIATPASFSETIAGNPSPQLQVSYTPTTNPLTYGQTIQLTAKLVPSSLAGVNATGTVTFLDNNVSIGTATISGGSATLSYMPQFGANQVFTASYGGDSNFSASTNSTSATLTVNPLGITAAVPSITLVYNPIFGASVPAQVTALASSGTLTGVLPVDAANVIGNYSSTGLIYFTVNNVASPTGTAAVGVYPMATALSGPAGTNAYKNYAVTSTSGTVTITQAGTSTTLTSSNYFPAISSSVTLTAIVTSLTSGTPTGTVNFYNGTTLLGSGTLTNGKATLATTALPAGADTLTATFVIPVNSNFTASTSAPITVTPAASDFSIALTPSNATLAQGDTAAIALTVTTAGSFVGTLSFSCSGLPANAYCSFVPVTVTTAASTTTTPPSNTLLMEIITSGPGTAIGNNKTSGKREPLLATLFGLSGLLLCGTFAAGRRLRKLRLAGAALCAFILCLSMGLGGCGNGKNVATAILTPTGTSTINVTGTSGAVTHSTTLTLVVVQVR